MVRANVEPTSLPGLGNGESKQRQARDEREGEGEGGNGSGTSELPSQSPRRVGFTGTGSAGNTGQSLRPTPKREDGTKTGT